MRNSIIEFNSTDIFLSISSIEFLSNKERERSNKIILKNMVISQFKSKYIFKWTQATTKTFTYYNHWPSKTRVSCKINDWSFNRPQVSDSNFWTGVSRANDVIYIQELRILVIFPSKKDDTHGISGPCK